MGNKLQLLGVSAMFIASKVEEMYAPEINDFVYITDNAYTAAEIRQMELRMLNTLGFNFSRPLPLHFLSLRLLEPNATLANTWNPTLEFYSTYSAKQIIPIVCKLAVILTRRDENKMRAVHIKYMNKKYMKVGELSDLQGDVVQKLSKKQLTNL